LLGHDELFRHRINERNAGEGGGKKKSVRPKQQKAKRVSECFSRSALVNKL
jgi:stalled ribosome alternative rescue factor ArfA